MTASVEAWVLEYCNRPRTMDQIMYGELPRLLTDRGVKLPRGYAAWWAYLRDVTNESLNRGYLHRNANEQIVAVVTITHSG